MIVKGRNMKTMSIMLAKVETTSHKSEAIKKIKTAECRSQRRRNTNKERGLLADADRLLRNAELYASRAKELETICAARYAEDSFFNAHINSDWVGAYAPTTNYGKEVETIFYLKSNRLSWNFQGWRVPCTPSFEETLEEVLADLPEEVVERALTYKFRTNAYFCYWSRSGKLELNKTHKSLEEGQWVGDLLLEMALKKVEPGSACVLRTKGLTLCEILDNLDEVVENSREIKAVAKTNKRMAILNRHGLTMEMVNAWREFSHACERGTWEAIEEADRYGNDFWSALERIAWRNNFSKEFTRFFDK